MVDVIKNNTVKILVIIYFVVAFVEVAAEFTSNNRIIFITKPLIPFLIIVLYWFSSQKRNFVFILIMFFSLVTNILFIPKSAQALYYAIIAFTIHRVLLVYFVFALSKIKNYIPFILATIPLLFIFFYLFFTASDVPDNSYIMIVIVNILGAVLGGIGISNYVHNDNKQNSLLMIAVLLFLGLQLVVFVERYYLSDLFLEYIRPLAMLLNVLAFFAFYKYVIEAESDNNRLAL